MSRLANLTPSVVLIAALGLLAGCDVFLGPSLVGSGILISEQREIEPFTKVAVSGAIEAEITRGDTPFVEISGDDNLVPIVITEVRGQTLVVRTANGRIKPQQDLQVRIETPEFSGADVSGACEVDIQGFDSDTVTLDVSGASDVSIAGACRKLIADLSGACDLDAAELTAMDVRLLANGQLNGDEVEIIETTPPYSDYVWAAQSAMTVATRNLILDAFLALDATLPEHRDVLQLQGANAYLPAGSEDFDAIRAAAELAGMLHDEVPN